MPNITHEVTYPHPPERVWRALTEPAQLREWLMETTFREAKAGHRFRFTADPVPGWNGITDCVVREVQPLRKLSYTWAGSNGKGEPYPPTTVTWTLTPTPDGGTKLRLEHTGLTGFRGLLMFLGMNNGWGRKMMRGTLPKVLDAMAVP
ncbi:MAG: SRPBCC domain-containing protein, partial [Halobacteriales archaeon]|nr:SRPBCC domain-containing protein [Halobacteriales archaeon]